MSENFPASDHFPFVVFVILNWNQGQLTADCLDSLACQQYPNFQVVVVDNGSTDGSDEMLHSRFPNYEFVLNGKNVGYSEGNNVGIRKALELGAEKIFLLNNDTLVDPGMLSTLVRELHSQERIGAVGPTMFYAEPPDVLWGGENCIHWRQAREERKRMDSRIDWDSHSKQPSYVVDYIDTCAILVDRQVIEKVGLLDPRYFINYDDLDFNLRIREAGYKVLYVPSARMWHRVSAAMGPGSPATTYYMTRNSLLFFWTHSPGLLKWTNVMRIMGRTLRSLSAWTLNSKYHTPIFRKRRAANLYALRDFLTGRFGKMGPGPASVCFGQPKSGSPR